MKISYNWLKQYIKPVPPPAEVAALLTGCGLEVESMETVETVKGGLRGLVIGEVKTKTQHPNADRLSLTTVDVGTGTFLNIVCGAPNVAAGQKVVVAMVGITVNPIEGEPFEIKKSKIRGEISEGMICAEDEIGLGKSHEGLLILKATAVIGTSVRDYFKVEDDVVFEIGLTPNHADAASHYGVARELNAVLHSSPVTVPARAGSLPSVNDFKIDNKDLPITVEVQDTNACPRYSGITISNVKVEESPAWLKNKLKSIGVGPINNIVDITNYVLHECGQPLHAFDADEIKGRKIIVRLAGEGKKFVTLDEAERTLSLADLMICNAEEPMCIAGVFGGIKSGIKATTKNIFIESAYFNPGSIRKTSKHHSLKTDASFRFERGTDPEMTLYALKRAALLIKEITGGKISSEIVDVYPKHIKPINIAVNYERMNKLSGIAIDRKEIKNILLSLNIKIEKETAEGLELSIPTYKNDVTGEADIVEEVLRIYGYNNIPFPQGIKMSVPKGLKVDEEKLQNNIADYLSSQGFFEMVNNSLTKSKWTDENVVKILNPLSNDLDVMRQSLIYSGLQAIEYNRNRKRSDLKLYEFGKVYRVSRESGVGSRGMAPPATYSLLPTSYQEETRLVLFLTGKRNKEQWNADKGNFTLHSLKSYINGVLLKCGADKAEEHTHHLSFLSTAMKASLNNEMLVQYGSVKKTLLKQFDINSDVFFADFNWDMLVRLSVKNKVVFTELPKFPEVKRDLSMVLDRHIHFGEIEKIAFATERKLLKEVNLFDVYEGNKIEQGKKSYAISFILQDNTQTLTDAQIDKAMNRLMESFEKQVGAIIRK